MDILIADDHRQAAEDLRQHLQARMPELRVGMCPMPDRLHATVVAADPRVVVLGYATPDLYLAALGHAARLTAQAPRIVLLGTAVTEADWTSALISAALPRTVAPARLVETLSTLLTMEAEFVPLPMRLGAVEGRFAAALDLSPIHLAVGRLVSQGLGLKAVAERLRLEEAEVSGTLAEALRHLGLTDRQGFADWSRDFFDAVSGETVTGEAGAVPS